MDTKSRPIDELTPQQAPPGVRSIKAPPRRKRSALSTLLWALAFALLVIAIVWFALSRASGSGAAGAGGGHGRGGRGGRGGAQATTVSVAQVGRGDVPIYLNQLGTVTPLATVTVTSQVSGFLQRVGFTEGQMVQKGQFLAQIDPRPYQAALLQAQGTLARDLAALAQAQLDLKRYRLLLSQDSIASQTVDQQAATVLQDQGTVKTDQGAIAADRLNIAYAHVTSPVTGRVGLRLIDVGNYVSTVSNVANFNTTTPSGIVVVTQQAPMDVEFTMPEDNLPQVEARVRAGATLPVVAFDRTGTTELARGRLLTLDNQVDTSTGTVRAKARFDNGAGTLFPQQFVNVRILVDTLKNAVIAPNNAVLRGADGLYVYAVQGQVNHHTVAVRNIKTGDTDGTNTAITEGLQPGETVVTDGSDKLKQGAQVILPGDCIPAFGGAGGHGGHRHGGAAAGGAASGGAAPAGAGAAAPSGGCPKGETRETAGGAKASADAGAGASAATGPGSSASSGDSSGAQPAPAGQGEGGQGPGRGQGGRMQAMLAQLDLDPQQQLKAQALFTAARGEAMTSLADAGDDPDARHKAMAQAYDKAFGQLEPLLRPDQKAKLAQLRAQMAAQRAKGGGQ